MHRLFLVLFFWLSASTTLDAKIVQVRLSAKFFLDSEGNGPTPGILSTHEQLREQVRIANEILAEDRANWRFDLDEIVDLDGLSEYYGPLSIDRDGSFWRQLERSAESDPETYAWRFDAINLYIVNEIIDFTGVCSFPNRDDVIIISNRTYDDLRLRVNLDFPEDVTPFVWANILLHEVGHYFDLGHTQGRFCGGCDPGRLGVCHVSPGDDGIDDTPDDLACWDRDQLADFHFSRPYEELNEEEREFIRRAFNNIMSYHNEGWFLERDSLFTPGQLERIDFVMETVPSRGRVSYLDCRVTIPTVPDGVDVDGDGIDDSCETDCAGDADACGFLRGDANSDGVVDLSDGVRILSFLFLGSQAPSCLAAADADDNDQVALTDSIVLFNYLFLGG
ncbi:MAG: hypothetical protein AAF517_10575, partial [Planctomycetota bacterium]